MYDQFPLENNDEQAAEVPVCNIDKRRPNQTYISPWRDKQECHSVYELIFNSPREAIEPKEHALRWLKMWRIRLMKDFPILVRCTFEILEAQVSDLRNQQDEKRSINEKEIKHIYAGAFTRFINLLTERFGGFKKKSIADIVRDIGIETYLVELRHLCAHSSVSISIDVFRRSAQYCMDWLKQSYWQQELAGMQPVTVATIQRVSVPADQLRELTELLQLYNSTTAACLSKGKGLPAEENQQLKAYAKKHRLKHLYMVKGHLLMMMQELKLPATDSTANVICKAVFDNCKRMFSDVVKYADDNNKRLGDVHTPLFRALTAMGCVETLFKQLMEICEQDDPADGEPDRRPGAMIWAYRIAFAFQLVKEYKQLCRTMPAETIARYGNLRTADRAAKWFDSKTNKEPGQHINLGLAVNCPWRLRVSREYVMARVAAVNEYTRGIVPILLFLLEPSIAPAKMQKIKKISEAFNPDAITIREASMFTPGHFRIHTEDDLLKRVDQKRTHSKANVVTGSKEREVEVVESKRARRCGLWTEAEGEIDWSSYPLGRCPANN